MLLEHGAATIAAVLGQRGQHGGQRMRLAVLPALQDHELHVAHDAWHCLLNLLQCAWVDWYATHCPATTSQQVIATKSVTHPATVQYKNHEQIHCPRIPSTMKDRICTAQQHSQVLGSIGSGAQGIPHLPLHRLALLVLHRTHGSGSGHQHPRGRRFQLLLQVFELGDPLTPVLQLLSQTCRVCMVVKER